MPETFQVHATAIALGLALVASAPPPLLGAGEPPTEAQAERSVTENPSAGPTEDDEGREPAEQSGQPADADQPAGSRSEADGIENPLPGPNGETGAPAEQDSTPGVGLHEGGGIREFGIGGGFGPWSLDLKGMQTEEGDWGDLVERSDALRGEAEEGAVPSEEESPGPTDEAEQGDAHDGSPQAEQSGSGSADD